MKERNVVSRLHWEGPPEVVTGKRTAIVLRLEDLKDWEWIRGMLLSLAVVEVGLDTKKKVRVTISFVRFPEDLSFVLRADGHKSLLKNSSQSLDIYRNVRANAVKPFEDYLPGDGKSVRMFGRRSKFKHPGKFVGKFWSNHASRKIRVAGEGPAQSLHSVRKREGKCAIVIMIEKSEEAACTFKSLTGLLYASETRF